MTAMPLERWNRARLRRPRRQVVKEPEGVPSNYNIRRHPPQVWTEAQAVRCAVQVRREALPLGGAPGQMKLLREELPAQREVQVRREALPLRGAPGQVHVRREALPLGPPQMQRVLAVLVRPEAMAEQCAVHVRREALPVQCAVQVRREALPLRGSPGQVHVRR